jgi:hypothetical protein
MESGVCSGERAAQRIVEQLDAKRRALGGETASAATR